MGCTYQYENGEICDRDVLDPKEERCLFHARCDYSGKDPGIFQDAVHELIRKVSETYRSNLSHLQKKFPKESQEEVQAMARLNLETRLMGFRFPTGFEFPKIEMISLNLDKSEFEGGISLFNAYVVGDISLSDVRVQEYASLNYTHVQGSVNFGGAQIKRNVSLWNTRINGFLSFNSARIQGKCYLKEAHMIGGLSIQNADLNNSLHLDESVIAKNFLLSRTRCGGRVYIIRTRFIPEPFGINKSEKNGPFRNLVLFHSVRLENGALFAGTEFLLPTSFSYTELGGIVFDNVDLHLVSFLKCRLGGVDFRNCRFLNAVERPGRFPLRSSYEQLLDHRLWTGGEDIPSPTRVSEVHIKLPIPKTEDIFTFMEMERKKNTVPIPESYKATDLREKLWNLKIAVTQVCFSEEVRAEEIIAQYQEIKKNMENRGNPVEAGDFYFGEMEFARYEKTRGEHARPFWKKFRFFHPLNLYRLLNGYGERPLRTLGWLAIFILLFTQIYLCSGLRHTETFIERDPKAPGYQVKKTKIERIQYSIGLPATPVGEILNDYSRSLLYAARNVIPFVNRGGSATEPAGELGRFLTMVEQFLGATLIGLMLFAMRRRFKR